VHLLSDARVDSLKQILSAHPGDSQVFLHVGEKCIRLTSAFSVNASHGLVAELRELLGADCLTDPAGRLAAARASIS
jgi:hypothetical protein